MRPGWEKVLLFIILSSPLLARAEKFSLVTIFSNGPAGKVWTGLMGEYRLVVGLRTNGRNIWRLGEEEAYLFQGEDQHWYVGPDYNTTEVWGLRTQAPGLALGPESLSQIRWTYRDLLQKTSGETDQEIKIVQGSGWLCTVSEWSEWTSCSGYSGETRTRDRTRKSCQDCQKCPELSTTETCEYPDFLTVQSNGGPANGVYNSWSGEYSKLEETRANSRPVWQLILYYEDTKKFFLYGSDGHWMIDSDYSSSNKNGRSRGIISSDQAGLEHIPRSGWSYQDSGWKPDPNLTVVPADFPRVVTIFSNGPAESSAQKWSTVSGLMGGYQRHSSLQGWVTANGRPVWRRGNSAATQFDLFADSSGQWFVGSDYEDPNTRLWIRTTESGQKTLPETGWEYWEWWETSDWKSDSELRVVPGAGVGKKWCSQLVGGEVLIHPDVQRHENVSGPSVCGNLCLDTDWCRFWAWNYWSWLCQLTKEESPPNGSLYKTPSEDEHWTFNKHIFGGKRLFEPSGTQVVSLNEEGVVTCKEQSDCPSSYLALSGDFATERVAFGCEDGICMDLTGTGCLTEGHGDSWSGCQVTYTLVCASAAIPLRASSSTAALGEISTKRVNGRCPNRLYCEVFDLKTQAPGCCLVIRVRRGVVGCPRSCT